MIWLIVLAIVIAGYLIGAGIQRSTAARIASNELIEKTRLNQERELAESKQQAALESSPHYQKMLNLSLEYLDYLEEYDTRITKMRNSQIVALAIDPLTKQQAEKFIKQFKEDEEELLELQSKHFSKWDKVERQLDPRHNLLVSNPGVGARWSRRESHMQEFNKLRERVEEMKIKRPQNAKLLAL